MTTQSAPELSPVAALPLCLNCQHDIKHEHGEPDADCVGCKHLRDVYAMGVAASEATIESLRARYGMVVSASQRLRLAVVALLSRAEWSDLDVLSRMDLGTMALDVDGFADYHGGVVSERDRLRNAVSAYGAQQP